ncbi:hypothetical protein BH20GEM2_BH20GEM2_19010 [soil metagenome]
MTYRIEWKRRALKQVNALERKTRERVIAALERLAATGQGDVTKLVDVDPPEYRLRLGTLRVRFARDDAERLLTILRVLPRGGADR